MGNRKRNRGKSHDRDSEQGGGLLSGVVALQSSHNETHVLAERELVSSACLGTHSSCTLEYCALCLHACPHAEPSSAVKQGGGSQQKRKPDTPQKTPKPTPQKTPDLKLSQQPPEARQSNKVRGTHNLHCHCQHLGQCVTCQILLLPSLRENYNLNFEPCTLFPSVPATEAEGALPSDCDNHASCDRQHQEGSTL